MDTDLCRRRSLGLAAGAMATGVAALVGCGAEGTGPKEVLAVEDLMREHGVLKRILLVYDEAARRLDAKQDLPPDAVRNAASIIRSFIEDYHEKLEEEHLFPRFEKAGKLVDLVNVLRGQHQAGRRLTDEVQRLAASISADRARLAVVLRQFARMYRPHEAREDTVLFPAFRALVPGHEYEELGEAFEEREHALFGEHGFEDAVAEVAKLEQTLGIYDLAAFTPR